MSIITQNDYGKEQPIWKLPSAFKESVFLESEITHILEGSIRNFSKNKLQKCHFFLTKKHFYYSRKNKVRAALYLDWPKATFSPITNTGNCHSFEAVLKLEFKQSSIYIYIKNKGAWTEALRNRTVATNFNDIYFMQEITQSSRIGPSLVKIIRKKDKRHFLAKAYCKDKFDIAQSRILKNEIELLLALKGHPNLNQIEEVQETEEEIMLITEFINGKSLDTLIGAVKCPTEMRKSISFGIFSALNHMKEKKVIHRNLHPKNIIIEEHTLVPKLIGFSHGLFAGTVPKNKLEHFKGFVAPEIFYQQTQYRTDYRYNSDVYAAGTIHFSLYKNGDPGIPKNNVWPHI